MDLTEHLAQENPRKYGWMIQAEERWAAIEGYPDYAVSSHGRVKSVRYDRFLKPRENSYGLQRVVLYKDREPHDFYVHHLVAAAFIDGYEEGLRVFPRDGDRSNNDVYNLRFREGQRMGQLVKNPPQAQLRRVMVVELEKIFPSVQACADFIGGHASSIYRVLRNERPSHLGYTFQYVEETV